MSEEETGSGTESELVVDAEDDDDIDIEISDEGEQVEETKTEQDIEAEELEKLKRDYCATTSAEVRLVRDFRSIQRVGEESLGFRVQPIGGRLNHWRIEIFDIDKKTQFYKDMQKYKKMTGKDTIEMIMSFPPSYPNRPPFVRVVRPRFMNQTGRVTAGGSLCMDMLTIDGWNPMYDVSSIISNATAEIFAGGPRINFNYTAPYSLQEAKDAYLRVSRDHNWKASDWLPDEP